MAGRKSASAGKKRPRAAAPAPASGDAAASGAPGKTKLARTAKSTNVGSVDESSWDETVVQRFRDFVRIPTISNDGPSGPYEAAVAFLKGWAEAEGFETQTHVFVEGCPILVVSWPGKRHGELPSLLLNSHYDVVPVVREKWTHDPFSAFMDAEGNIFGRGTQDMKCVGVQHLEALARLKKRNTARTGSSASPFERTVHVSFVPDEETSGPGGMAAFAPSAAFAALNVGFALDEGYASPTDAFKFFHGERTIAWVQVEAQGKVGHGSQFIEGTAMQKLLTVVRKFAAFRQIQERKVKERGVDLGHVTTVNLSMLQGGTTLDGGRTFLLNVLPDKAVAGFDVRVSPSHMSMAKFRETLDGWTKEDGVSYEFLQGGGDHYVTPIEHPWCEQLLHVLEGELHFKLEKGLFPAATDSRLLRKAGIPACGFSPIDHTPILLHDHDEFLNRKTLVKGVAVFERVVSHLADVGAGSPVDKPFKA